MPDELKFGVSSLMDLAKLANKQIGLVIDLTNTNKYYNKGEWADYGVKYLKMNCPGHEVNEREDLVVEFIKSVRAFVEDPENEGKLVGVHCTHGLNRTGYLICRYMIEVDGYTAADAISMFEYYRGHPMEREHYKITLYETEARLKNGGKTIKSQNEQGDKPGEEKRTEEIPK